MSRHNHRFIILSICLLLQLAADDCFAQCLTGKEIYAKLLVLEQADSLTTEQKLVTATAWKKMYDDCRLVKDSIYARLLHRIGTFTYLINNNKPTLVAISYTQEAIRINMAASKGASKRFVVNSCFNLGMYYEAQKLYEKALRYYDTALLYNQQYPEQQHISLYALYNKSDIYFQTGEYQKNVESSSLGIDIARNIANTEYLLKFYNQRAQALVYQNNISALKDIDSAMLYARMLNNNFEMATAYKSKAFFYEKNKDYTTAESLFINAIEERKKAGTQEAVTQLPEDYNDYGNFLLNAKKDYTKAQLWYSKYIAEATRARDDLSLARAYTNIGQASFRLHRLEEAQIYYAKATALLHIAMPHDFLQNASAAQMSQVYNKELLLVLLNNKTELLLQLYKAHNSKKYLLATLQLAMLTDTVITQSRHEQIGEQSKLYWRDRTREFFTNAIEACYLDNNIDKAFYFIEKSRAVLLGDKLNELGALAHIPAKEAAQEEHLQLQILEEQQQLLSMPSAAKEYNLLQSQHLRHKQELEWFIQSLEQKYPNYYQYKYADNIPGLQSLQQYLAKNHQSFVHYFMNDTVMYVLGFYKNSSRFIKLSKKDFDTRQLTLFLQLCSDKEKLKSNYALFAAVAQNIYNKLVRPLQLPKGKVAICTDNFLIPFEALCTDGEGRNFLLNDYSFSYVYSARTFMKPFASNGAANGNFIGFAPVAFASTLRLVSLNQSAEALSASADFYNNRKLFTQNAATRGNFFSNASKYKVIAIFSHAQADTTGLEPVLYLHDSAIQLSELQLLQKPSAQLVLLSACQTNIGKTAAGEGIYSLARGFAAAGIPAVAGTLWKADDQTIYRISSKFNEYLAAGMNKSEALQKAKLWFIGQNKDERQLPYYWANMVLIGNTQSISLLSDKYNWWQMIGACFGLAVIIAGMVLLVKNRKPAGKLQHKKPIPNQRNVVLAGSDTFCILFF